MESQGAWRPLSSYQCAGSRVALFRPNNEPVISAQKGNEFVRGPPAVLGHTLADTLLMRTPHLRAPKQMCLPCREVISSCRLPVFTPARNTNSCIFR